MAKTILITGATSGIGKACALLFAEQGFNLVITGRRSDRLEELKNEICQKFGRNVETMCFDVQDRKTTFESFGLLYNRITTVDILLNNAGLALGRDNFKDAELDDWDTMLHTNVNGLLYVTKAALPLLQRSNAAHIINIGSIAGKQVYENGGVYCASKFAVDAISQSMRIDLLYDKIKVTAVHPGAVETEFSIVRFKGDEPKACSVYKGYNPLTALDVANVVYYVVTLPPHVCINEITVMPTAQADAHNICKS